MAHLIHNALQAMDYKGRLAIAIRRADNETLLSVTDSGHGIPADIRPKIFDAFFTTRRTGEGSGLGLYLVKKIVDKHGGRIEIQTEVGVTGGNPRGTGTTVTVCLPMRAQ